MPPTKLRKIFAVLRSHHSQDAQFLAGIARAMSGNAPWRCGGCRQLRKHTATFCQTCQQPWQNTIDRTYVHQPGGRQDYAANWNYDQTGWGGQQGYQNWSRARSKSRTQTPKGRRSKSAQSRGPGKGQGKGFTQPMPPPPMPPPTTAWTNFNMQNMPNPQMMMMSQGMPFMPPPQSKVPPSSTQQATSVAPTAPTFQSPIPPQLVMDSEQREFMEMARARQSELPPDMRQKMQKLTKKEGAQATKELHSAVRTLGFARKDVEEALQARSNLIGSWKSFLSGAVQTWQEYTVLFQNQERELQERIQQAHLAFAQAKQQAEQSQQEAGKITAIEIKDDDEELDGDQSQADLSSGKIHEGLKNLTASLQQLQQQAEAIEIEEKAAKRPRTTASQMAADMETGDGGPAEASKPPFVSPGCA